jgi:hypothetical protein
MKTIIVLAAALAGLALSAAGPAAAGDLRCPTPGASAVAQERIGSDLKGMGYRILEAEVEHRCYVFVGVNDSGFPIEVTYSPGTGEMLRAKLH